MISNLLARIAAVLALASALPASAALLTRPASLLPGDEFRVVFISSATRDAMSSNIADYDAFIAGLAAAAGIDSYFGTVVTWQALGSTAAVNAIDRVGLDAPPIFLVNGVGVANSGADLWDGSIDVPIVLDERGFSTDGIVFTGTRANGMVANDPLGGFVLPSTELGLSSIITTDSAWISVGAGGSTVARHLYGVSSVLTVPDQPATVPEPSTVALLVLGLAALLTLKGRWKHGSKNHGFSTAADRLSTPIAVCSPAVPT